MVWCRIGMRNNHTLLQRMCVLVVVWCIIGMRNNRRSPCARHTAVVVWCRIGMRNNNRHSAVFRKNWQTGRARMSWGDGWGCGLPLLFRLAGACCLRKENVCRISVYKMYRNISVPSDFADNQLIFIFAHPNDARMAESVDALVSNTSGAIRAGSTPAPGTFSKYQIADYQLFGIFILTSMSAICPHFLWSRKFYQKLHKIKFSRLGASVIVN